MNLARAIRDVTFSRGYIRCVEFEELVEHKPMPAVPDPWDMDELQDSESADDPPEEEEEDVIVGWSRGRALFCRGSLSLRSELHSICAFRILSR